MYGFGFEKRMYLAKANKYLLELFKYYFHGFPQLVLGSPSALAGREGELYDLF